MELQLTPQQLEARAGFRLFSNEEIAPFADRYDKEERIPSGLIRKMAERGYLGSVLPKEWGGGGLDMITYGLLNEEIARGCSSARSLITVHDMLAYAILKWGSENQRRTWLPILARGERVGAFAVSEPNIGSDPKSVRTTANRSGDRFILSGKKKWITFGQIADVFLVLAQYEGKPTPFIVERERQGVSTKPITGMLGVRASMLAEVSFDECEIPAGNLLGRPGFGLASVLSTALGLGRYTVAWGCVGIAQACLESSIRYTNTRKQFDVLLKEHQLVRQMLTDMITSVKAARLLCYQAGYLKQTGDPREIMETFIAKYFASGIAMKAACDAVQLHGANGCSADYPVQRYMRDAKIMEIIEGSNQIQQITIADYAYQEYQRRSFEEAAEIAALSA